MAISGTVGSDNATSELKVFIRAHLRGDWVSMYENAFATVTGVVV